MTAPLAIRGVSHRYGQVTALDDVSLEVTAGTFTVLLGVNGAGKTTLFNLITGLFAATSGSIEVCGHHLATSTSSALASMGVVFQSRALDPSLTVAQNIIYQGALHGLGRKIALERGEALLSRMHLADRMGEKAARLSGGQQRRVEIARAMLHQPRLILCDEATVGLDVKSRSAIVEDLHSMATHNGLGVLWATHLIDEVMPNDPVHVLHRGEILTCGPAKEVAGEKSLSDAFLDITGAAA